MGNRILILGILLFGLSVHAKPIEVSVPWLLNVAIQGSETVKLQKNSVKSVNAGVLRAESTNDASLTASASYSKDQRESSNSLFGSDSREKKVSVGLSKQFTTGTKLNVEIASTDNDEQQASFSQSGITTKQTIFNESTFSMSIKQSLLKNGFGGANKAGIQSAEKNKESMISQSYGNTEDLLAGLIDQYYQAWSMIQSLKTSRKRVERETNRLSIYKRQYRQGFAQREDILQLKSSLQNAKSQAKDAETNIEEIFINLGSSVGFDFSGILKSGFQNIRFSRESYDDVLGECKLMRTPEGHFHSYDVSINELKKQAANYEIKKATSNKRPDLYLDLSFMANGVDEETGEAVSETFGASHPRYYVGLGFKYTFGGSQVEADRIDAMKKRSESEIRKSIAQTEALTNWNVNCRKLLANIEKKEILTEMVAAERERILILDKNFRTSKVDLNTLTQAEDSLASSELKVNQLIAEIHKSTWKLRRLKGGLKTFVNSVFAVNGAGK